MKEDERMIPLKVRSTAFECEDWIPNQFSGYGEDISPEIYIVGLTDSAVSIAITLDDLGHPIEPGYNHWVAWNIPPVDRIPQGLPKGAIIEQPFHAEQGLAYGKHCYRGPKPPFNWNHNYLFTVYVLDTTLALGQDATKRDLLKAVEGHVLQKGELIGKYQRKHK